MPDWLDLILALLTAVFAISGYRQGFTIGMLSLTGFACGAAAGALVGPGFSQLLVPAPRGQALLEVVIEFVAAVTGMLLGSWLGMAGRDGSGFVIGPGHVLTNAHVVAGLVRPPAVATASGRVFAARVVLYDPRHDIAVLGVPGLQAAALHFTGPAQYGTTAIVAGYPRGGRLTLTAASIGRSLLAAFTTAATHVSAKVQIYSIRGQVLPGNSGSPLMAPNGSVYGVVFARAAGQVHLGWAITAAQAARDAGVGKQLLGGVPTPARLAC